MKQKIISTLAVPGALTWLFLSNQTLPHKLSIVAVGIGCALIASAYRSYKKSMEDKAIKGGGI